MLTAEALLPVAPPPIVVGTVAAPAGLAMTEQELTEELIAAAVAKVDAHVCTGQDGCYTFSEALQEARDTCTPKGQCRVGWVVEVGGPESWSVWVEVGTGRVTLISGANA